MSSWSDWSNMAEHCSHWTQSNNRNDSTISWHSRHQSNITRQKLFLEMCWCWAQLFKWNLPMSVSSRAANESSRVKRRRLILLAAARRVIHSTICECENVCVRGQSFDVQQPCVQVTRSDCYRLAIAITGERYQAVLGIICQLPSTSIYCIRRGQCCTTAVGDVITYD